MRRSNADILDDITAATESLNPSEPQELFTRMALGQSSRRGEGHDGDVVEPREIVREVARRHGLPREPIEMLHGRGSVNHVLRLGDGADAYVVRTPIDPLRRDEFEVEQWCLERATELGIPSPEVVARGETRGAAYIVLRYVEGHASEGGVDAWGALGRYGALAHAIDWTGGPAGLFTRFGRDPDEAWRRHLEYNADELTAGDPLIGLGVYRSTEQPLLRETVNALAQQSFAFGLRHGDLAPRNLVVRPRLFPVLLDWGQASVGPIPHGDLLAAYRSHLVDGLPTAAEIDAFSRAMGAPLSDVRPALGGLLVLEALDRVRWALDNRRDRVADLAEEARATLRVIGGA